MTNRAIAEALGLNMGKYIVRDTPKVPEAPLAYKIVTATSDSETGKSETVLAGGTKRKIQMVTPEEFMQITKRQCLTEPCITSVSQTSGVVTLSMGNKHVSAASSSSSSTTSATTPTSSTFGNIKLKEALARGSGTVVQNHSPGNVTVTEGITTHVVSAEDIAPVGSDDGTISIAVDGQQEGDGTGGDQMGIKTRDVGVEGDQNEVLEGAESAVTHSVSIENQVIEDNAVRGTNGQEMMDTVDANEFTHGEAVIESGELDQDVTTEVIMTEAVSSVPQDSELLKTTLRQKSLDVKIGPQAGAILQEEQQEVGVEEEVNGVVAKKDTESLVIQDRQQVDNPAEALHVEQGEQAPQESTSVHNGDIIVNSQQVQSQEHQIVTQDGQTVLFTNDGGQTYYQQNLAIEPPDLANQDETQQQEQQPQQQQEQEIPIEATSQQLVSMETPEGLVEGQLVTNEDGTQFLIHQQPAEQQVYQTPEGLILIQNPDGTLRIHNNGDQQIPLEAVQALLAVDGEGQVQVEGSSLEQAT